MLIRKAQTLTVDPYGREVSPRIPDAFEEMVKDLRDDMRKRRHLIAEYEMSFEQGETTRGCIKEAEVAIRLLSHGFEPTAPPDFWYLGAYKGNIANLRGWKRREFMRGSDVGTFIAPVPKTAVARYKEAISLGVSKHQVGIYSPNEADFRVSTLHADPLMVCRLIADKPYYFEIARWDTARDLAALLEQ